MRKFIVFILILVSVGNEVIASSQEQVAQQRKKVGLVLGGGGAKGAAHVGVLKVIEDAGIPVDYIAGTSIGAIVGGLYSIGYDAESLDSLVNSLDWSYLLSNNAPQGYRSFRARDVEGKYLLSIPYSLKKKNEIPAGLISGQNILNLFSGLTIGYQHMDSFRDLPTPFNCVATDLVSEDYVVLDKGSLPLSMRSSMSIPGVFLPVKLDSMVLVDGGVINNFPSNVARDMGADILIGVDLSTGKTPTSQLTTLMGLINTLTDITGKNEYEKNKRDLDLYLNPDLKGFQTMDFNRQAMDSMYQRGVEAARAHWGDLMKIKKEIYGDSADLVKTKPRELKHITKADTLHLGEITILGVSDKTKKYLREKIKLKKHTKITLKNIDEAIAILDGMDIFSSVTYQLSDSTPYHLTFTLVEQALNQLNVGFRFDSEEMASILLNTTFYENFFKGSKLSTTIRLNISPYVAFNYEWRPNFNSKFAMAYKIGYDNYNLYNGSHKVDVVSYLWQQGEFKYGVLLKNWELEAGLRWDFFGNSSDLYNPNYNPIGIEPDSYFNYFVTLGLNSLDNIYYPTKGVLAHLKGELITTNFVKCHDNAPIGAISADFLYPVKLAKKLYL
ncbi:MAG: patatin-like phospholipase family protein, partial [Tannerellaceae bacterium]